MSSQQPHISDVAIWGTADRNYWVYFALAVVLGFIGADHIYLRSYGTAFQKFLFNCVSFGFWYWWDVLQAATESDKITREGLRFPFDWGSQSIGKGVFGTEKSPPKDYVIYTLLAIFLGWMGADRFYLGQWTSGVLKFASVFFIVGWLWVVFDAVNAVLFPRSIVTSSGSYGFPFSLLEVGGCHQFTGKDSQCSQEPQKGGTMGLTAILDWIAKTLGFPQIPYVGEGVANSLRAVATVIDTAPNVSITESSVPPAESSVPPVESSVPSAEPKAAESAIPEGTPTESSTTTTPPAAVVQQGGGRETTNTGPVIAGALAALVIAGSLKAVYDFVGSR